MLKSVGKVLSMDFINSLMRAPRANEIAEGVYLGGFNLNRDLIASGLVVNTYPFGDLYTELFSGSYTPGTPEYLERLLAAQDAPNDFGVCDRWEQIVKTWPELLTDPRHFVIGLAEVRRDEQPAWGGWRWHKWGEYIGDFEPQQEYLS
jgi:hypothetical protein